MVRYLRKGSSGLSDVPVRLNARPVSAGDHRCCAAPHSFAPAAPWTISMQTSRVRSSEAARAVFDHRPPAGTIASRNGSATAAPSPRSTARRGMCFPVMNDISLSPSVVGAGFQPAQAALKGRPYDSIIEKLLLTGDAGRRCHSLDALHPERGALHDPEHVRRCRSAI